VLRPVEDQFYGGRGGKFEDSFGHRWRIAGLKEDLSPGELKAKSKALYAAGLA
jgi:PhnB protein